MQYQYVELDSSEVVALKMFYRHSLPSTRREYINRLSDAGQGTRLRQYELEWLLSWRIHHFMVYPKTGTLYSEEEMRITYLRKRVENGARHRAKPPLPFESDLVIDEYIMSHFAEDEGTMAESVIEGRLARARADRRLLADTTLDSARLILSPEQIAFLRDQALTSKRAEYFSARLESSVKAPQLCFINPEEIQLLINKGDTQCNTE